MKTNEKISFDLNQFKSNGLVSCKGTKKETIYKDSIFEGMDESEKKRTRKKIRNLCENFCSSILAITDKKKCENLAKDFSNFYNSVYRINDFSVSSILSQNADEKKINIFSQGIEKFKTILNK